MALCGISAYAQPWQFTDDNDKFYDEPIDSVSGRWTRIYRGNDSIFFAKKTACASILDLVQIGVSNAFYTKPIPRLWSIRLSADGGRTWKESWNQTYFRKFEFPESFELRQVYYPSPSTVVVFATIEKFIRLDSNLSPVSEYKQIMIRTFDMGKSWIIDSTFNEKNLGPNEGIQHLDLSAPNQGVIATRIVNSGTEIQKLYLWNYYFNGVKLLDTLYEVPFPAFLQNSVIDEIVSRGAGPKRIYLFTNPNALDDPQTAISGAYTSDGGKTWLPMPKRCFAVRDKVTLLDLPNSPGTLFLGGPEIFFNGDRGDIRNDEVIRVSTDGGITQKELWRKRRPPFSRISHFKFADDKRGMFVIPRYRNYGNTYITRPDGKIDTAGNYGNELMIYRTDDGGITWVREPWDRLYHTGSPVSDMASGITDLFFRRDASGNRLRIMTNQRDVFSFEPIATSSVAGQEITSKAQLTIAPNPTSQSIRIAYTVPDEIQPVIISIFNAIGTEMLQIEADKIADSNTDINVSNYPVGMYYLRLTNGKLISSQTFSIIR